MKWILLVFVVGCGVDEPDGECRPADCMAACAMEGYDLAGECTDFVNGCRCCLCRDSFWPEVTYGLSVDYPGATSCDACLR